MEQPIIDFYSSKAFDKEGYLNISPELHKEFLWKVPLQNATTVDVLQEIKANELQMIFGTVSVLKEKLHDMALINAKCPNFFTQLKAWFDVNSVLSDHKCKNSLDNFLRMLVMYTMAVDGWFPPPINVEKYAGPAIPMHLLITSIWANLTPVGGEMEEEAKNELFYAPFPMFEDDVSISVTARGSSPLLLEYSQLPKAEEAAHLEGMPTHSVPITAPQQFTISQMPATRRPSTGGTHLPPISTQAPAANVPAAASSVEMQALLQAVQGIQDHMYSQQREIQEIKSIQQGFASTNAAPIGQAINPYTAPLSAQPTSSGNLMEHIQIPAGLQQPGSQGMQVQEQNLFNLQLLEVLQELKKPREKPQSHVCEAWEVEIIPYVTCTHVIKVHDYPMNVYGQRASVNAAQSLMHLYELHWSQEMPHLAQMPRKIPVTSHYHTLALKATESLKNSMAAHAFPKADKPQLKERTQVLQAVMGKDLAPGVMATAYNQSDQKGKQNQGQGQNNWQKGKGGGGGGRGGGRGDGGGGGRGYQNQNQKSKKNKNKNKKNKGKDGNESE